ncbi:hypothetical protein SJI00_12720 [Pseudomonas sp. RP23018S]|uniref:hypothetical protein n=1 Tax=Pseudomonas sp. RP23018S TaxID=3096037 RepID=UPI002AC9F8B5|nr:hypothetical protein [Pseudomonas sp. RP23018S]MDZ5603639.1 hypothetical protein [Pseudomonas sp. RP23018S]
MLRSPRFILPLLLVSALAACGKNDRDAQIDAQFPLKQNYETTIESIVPPFGAAHPNVPVEKIKEVVREHFTFDEYRDDIHKLYSEEHFTDAEFKQIAPLVQDSTKAQQLGKTPETKSIGEKLNNLMMQTATDPKLREQATTRVKDINEELEKLDAK